MSRIYVICVLLFTMQFTFSSSRDSADSKRLTSEQSAQVKVATVAAFRKGCNKNDLRSIPDQVVQGRMGEPVSRSIAADVAQVSNKSCPGCKLGGRECWISCWMNLCPPKQGLSEKEVNSCCQNPYGNCAVPCMLIGGTCCCGCDCCDS